MNVSLASNRPSDTADHEDAATQFTASQGWEVILADLERHRRRKATIRMHYHVWFDWCAFLGPRRRLDRISERDLDRYLAQPVRGHHSKGPRLSAASQHTYASLICGAYRRLHAARLLARDPLAGYVLPPVDEGPPRDLDEETVADLLEVASKDERDLALVMLAWGVGLRIGSIAQARIEDVDVRGAAQLTAADLDDQPDLDELLEADRAQLQNEDLDEDEGIGERVRPTPSMFIRAKGGRTGQVPLAALVATFLADYLADRPQSGPLIESRGNDPTKHLTPGHVGELLRRLLREVDAQRRARGQPALRATPHSLRHTFATTLLAAGRGRNLRGVSLLMLHASLRTTQRYTKGYVGDAAETIQLLRLPPKAPKAGTRKRRPAPGEGGAGRRDVRDAT
jgi:integrase